MAPVIQILAACPQIESKVCVTAQHREMLDQVLRLFKIDPDVDLNLMRPDQSLAELTADILTHLDPVLEQIQPDWMLIQGDTTTVMAAALLGYYRRIHIGHVEAGLRTGDKWQPFPEEIHRRIAGVVADLHFAPTETNRQNLLREGVPDDHIIITGNPVIDALHLALQHPYQLEPDLERAFAENERVILLTTHRRENLGSPLQEIYLALRDLLYNYPDLAVVFPVHKNPKVRQEVAQVLQGVERVYLTEPLDYISHINVMKRAHIVLTDSGGIQEEAPALGKPVLVLRDVTERPEAVAFGTARLVGANRRRVEEEVGLLLDSKEAYDAMANAVNPYGDGRAAPRIVQAVLSYWRLAPPPEEFRPA